MKEIELRSAVGGFQRGLAIVGAVTLFGISLLLGISRANDGLVVILLLGATICGAWLLGQRRKIFRIDRHGFTLHGATAKPLIVPWNEVEAIGVATVGVIQGGLYRGGGDQHVGILLSPSSGMAASKQCSDNRRLSDYDVLLSASYGMKVVEFAAFMNSTMRKSKF